MQGKIIIIGAGPAGLSCAYELSKRGKEVQVFESSEFIGGLSRSFDLWGQRVDLGPHRFFTKQKEINDFFKELVQDDFTMVDRQTRIFYNKKFFDYPLRLGNVLRNLSLGTIVKILWHYLVQMLFPIKDPKNFEEWVTNRFGKKLYEIFFKHYTEKLWGIKCTQIDADWAAQRIKTLSLPVAVASAIVGNKGNKHKTLVDQFAYPKNGTGMIYERAADAIRAMGNSIKTSTPIKRVLLDKDSKKATGIELMDGTIVEADYVVSTMPLTYLVNGLANVPKTVTDAVLTLYYRNAILVYLEIDRKDLFTDNWLYIHSPEVKHGRITNFRNWCPSLNRDKETSIVCMEYWCFDADAVWTQDEAAVVAVAKDEIYKINLIPNTAKVVNAKVVKIPKCYPVYEIGYQKQMSVIVNYLKSIDGLLPIGRYGAFKYNNQDHSILMGILAADKIALGKQVDLWAINTDTEYQEEGKIKDVLIQ